MTDMRLADLAKWVAEFVPDAVLTPLQGDASFRRYFRVTASKQSFIAVDAPPRTENSQAFVMIAQALEQGGLSVPKMHQVDTARGFLLISDLGDRLLLAELTSETVVNYYPQAFQELVKMGSCSSTALPHYDQTLLLDELNQFHTWYLGEHLGLSLSQEEMRLIERVYACLVDSALVQPQVFVHRDFHSRNLMLLPDGKLALIDFQDAVIGPITYDLVSLLRDCYITWPTAKVDEWVEQYWRLLISQGIPTASDAALFLRWFDWMGLQRHLKVLGVFARLYHRDGKAGYLQDIPRVLQYVLFVCDRYPQFRELRDFLISKVPYESHDSSSGARPATQTVDGYPA